MKRNSTFLAILFLFFSPVAVLAQAIPNQFTNYVQGGINSLEFTTNNFKGIAVGKGNLIWAGSQYGGLYFYVDSLNLWRKSTKLTNVSINDIKADADSGIWIAQSGQQAQSGNSAIAGGLNYFHTNSDISMEFYSVAGTTTLAHLVSRNARALYIDQSRSAVRGDLPRPWVAMSTYLTSFNTRRGGVAVGINRYLPYFTDIKDGLNTASNSTVIAESIGGNHNEVWVGTRQNGTPTSKIVRYRPDGSHLGYYTNLDAFTMLPAGFTAQAIYFDQFGNRWIGLRQGGLRVRKPDTTWVKMDAISFFTASTQVNLNAITEDEYGNVYIGTTDGLLEYESPKYNSLSSPDYTPSYKRYTTADGLPGNNVTGLSYDKHRGRLLITTDAGVSFMNRREQYIKGVVFDVYTRIDSTNNRYMGLQRLPLSSGVTVNLLKNGVVEESTTPNASGIFELKEADDNESYDVEVRYVKERKSMVYLYQDVHNHTLMEPTLMPDSLIGEIRSFRKDMERRCFPITMSFNIQLKPELFCTDAFNTAGYELAIEPFYAAGGITEDHTKQVDNLANYYAALKTVYRIGGDATELNTEAATNMLDALEAVIDLAEFGINFKNNPNIKDPEEMDEAYIKFVTGPIKAMKEVFAYGMPKVANSLSSYPDAKKLVERSSTIFVEVTDIVVAALEGEHGKRKNAGVLKFLVDNLKKIFAQYIAVDEYKNEYAQTRHKNFVQARSNAAKNKESEYAYTDGYNNLFNPSTASLAKRSADSLKSSKDLIATLVQTSKFADATAAVAEGGTLLALVPGGQAAAAVCKVVAGAAKTVKMSALFGAMYVGAKGANEISEISDEIAPKSGLLRMANPPGNQATASVLQSTTDSLEAVRARYLQVLAQLHASYTAPSYDSVLYASRIKTFLKEDSILSQELNIVINTLWSLTDNARSTVPQFESRVNKIVDSFATTQGTLRQSMYLQNLGYLITPDKASMNPGLDSLTTEIKLAVDSTVNGLVELFDMAATNNIQSMANLVQEGYKINHTRVPGTPGTFTYTFANRGSVPQTNVSFKINHPGGGYAITSADSINVGTVLPNQSVQVSFSFSTPTADSIGHYIIDVKADNGKYNDVTGSLYVIDPLKFYSVRDGNWSDPDTWSSNVVPTAANSVYVYHDIQVNVNATVKSATVAHPGRIVIETGKQLNVLE